MAEGKRFASSCGTCVNAFFGTTAQEAANKARAHVEAGCPKERCPRCRNQRDSVMHATGTCDYYAQESVKS